MRRLITEKLMASVGVGQQTAAEEGARNMGIRCQKKGAQKADIFGQGRGVGHSL